MLRKIIHIDEEKCTGCGACAEACHEGAIGMVDGKARLLREAGVAAAWGTSFGAYGEGHFRLSFANSLENLKIAVDRIAGFAAGLS